MCKLTRSLKLLPAKSDLPEVSFKFFLQCVLEYGAQQCADALVCEK